MSQLSSERLNLIAQSAELWTITEKSGETLGQIGFLHGQLTINLIPEAQRLGVATEAASIWLKAHRQQQITSTNPVDQHSYVFLKQLGFEDNLDDMLWNGTTPLPQYQTLNTQLGIETQTLKTPYHPSACRLVDIGLDYYNRPARMHPEAAKAWHQMQQAATQNDIKLLVVSAYRSPKYQSTLIKNKLKKGQSLDNILKINTAPGHSEHHTGCAIDLTSTDSTVLEIDFDQSSAFKWLVKHAKNYGFSLSYPKNNHHGIIYEPWHWCFNKT